MRYKEFNRNQVLEKCLPLFWKDGFGACAISDIVKATGVNRFSLYHEFTNKEGILYGTLDLYRERYSPEHLNILKQRGAPVEVLKAFYLSFLSNTKKQPGCFIVHIGTEFVYN